MKKFWNITSKVLVWMVILFTICVMLFTVISVRTIGHHDRDIFGYKAYIVLSDSMSKTDFSAGDLVLVKETDPTTLKEGDIISYISQNSNSKGRVVTHKIRSKTQDRNGDPAFITYGTTTNIDDDTPVGYSFILGKYSFRIPKLGSFFNFIRTTPGYVLCILLPFLLLIGWQAVNCVMLWRRYKSEQMEQLEKDKEELQAQRQKSEEMMEEIRRLKAQLRGEESTEAPQKDELSLESILEEFSEEA